MKKRDLAAFAMIITSAALLIGACNQQPTSGGTLPAAGMNQSNQAFMNMLSPEAKKKFNELDAKGKQMAMDQANQGMDPNQAVSAQYDAMKGRPPATPGNPPMPPKS